MVVNKRLILKNIRRLYWASRQDPVEEDLRGWNWDKPPVKPRAYLGLGVAEISSKYCPTRRDIWLRRVLKKQGKPTDQMIIGRIVHKVFHIVFEEARKLIVRGYSGWSVYEALSNKIYKLMNVENNKWVVDLYKTLLLSIAAETDVEQAVTGGQPSLGWMPWLTEFKVDGSQLGLSSTLSIDAIAEGGVIVEIKYGKPMDFHKLSLAGYSMALEANLEIPFDYGMIIYVNGIPNSRPRLTVKPVYISSSLRRWFLDERDEIIDMILAEEEPPKPHPCPEQCPYKEVCMT